MCKSSLRRLRHEFLALSAVSAITFMLAAQARSDDAPFVISVGDDVAVQSSSGEVAAKDTRLADRLLRDVDVRLTFDGLDVKPQLNVSTAPVRTSYRADEVVHFLATSNYGSFIDRAEIIVNAIDDAGRRERAATIPVTVNAVAGWAMPASGPKRYDYILRVYDKDGRFDETEALPLNRTEKDFASEVPQAIAPGWGEDRTALRNIRVYGGAVTVHGANAPQSGEVIVMGEAVPVDSDGRFVVQRIVPPGDHTVDVEVPRQDGQSVFVERDINIPSNDWFYVGLADVTLGYRKGSSGIQAVVPGEFDKMYSKGRLAFYLKGKIKGEYLLTAAADTREGKLSTLFRGLDEKDARSILRRLDPDDYYPVYGDDSTIEEDAPTQGKFYIRLERGDSHVMWGNYKTAIRNTRLLASNRALYGASARYRSPETTRFGERRSDVVLYAAQPGTLPHRDVFRGTGGSAYFLKHQDITTGSETIIAEVRDPVTGVVRETKTLIEGQDYDIDYIQGVLILRRPLPSITGTSDPVRSSALGGNNVWLVVNYEYTPAAGNVDGYVYGGRAERWMNDHVRVAVTGMSEKTATADQQALGADILLRKSEKTYLEAEIAASRGPGFTSYTSTDGGLTSSTQTAAGNRNVTALAWRVKAEADLAELTDDRLAGRIGGYIEDRKGGFQTLAWNTSVDERIWGAHATLDLSERLSIGAKYDDRSDANGVSEREGKASLNWKAGDGWKIALGLGYTQLRNPAATVPGYNGERLDAGLRIEYAFSDDLSVFAFGQATLARRGSIRANDRIGLGANWRVSDQVSLSGEVSYGDTGWGGLAAINYDPNADDHYYIGYKLDPERAWSETGTVLQGRDYGSVVVGSKRRLSDELSVFIESDYDIFGKSRTLGQTYGVNYTPNKHWTITGGLESGRIRDNRIVGGVKTTDFDRTAFSGSVVYKGEDDAFTARLRGEFRHERSSDGTRDADTWLGGVAVRWQPDESWRFLASGDLLFADSKGSSIRDGQYAEASLAAAYRPVDHDRLNLLFKYTFLHDLPGADQVNAAGDLLGPAQQSHILSADVNYDINRWLTVGAKYGMRLGRKRDRTTTIWSSADAHLGIIRADIHVVKKWDILLEARALHLPDTSTTDYGFLAAAYRHVGDNFKLGVGYNFGRFSDDLKDLTYDDQGVFVNMIGKF